MLIEEDSTESLSFSAKGSFGQSLQVAIKLRRRKVVSSIHSNFSIFYGNFTPDQFKCIKISIPI